MDDISIQPYGVIPASELSIRFSRSSGPGGQNVNKNETRVTLIWDLKSAQSLTPPRRARLFERLPPSFLTNEGELQVSSSKERDQARNRKDCEEKMAALVKGALRVPKRRRKTKPKRSAIEKRIRKKKHRGRIKALRKRPVQD